MKLKEIYRTSTFAWSPTASLPLIATGSVAGALDESFSNESQLEIWQPDFMDKNEYDLGGDGLPAPKGAVTDNSRFNRLAWGQVHRDRSRGVIAAGMENGELALWDPAKIIVNADVSESLILRNTSHTGPVRGLDFNPIQTNLLASGAINGEVYIWDLNDPSKPYSPTPGTRSTKLDEITSVAWNQQVQYVLAGASSTGYTVVWDLRGKREVVALAYGGGAGTLAGQSGVSSGMAVGGRRGMSAIAWHPDNATRLVTASEDDLSPVIMVWDLRNARAPEKILTGHEKGVLSLSWCKHDADLLLSCGKDNRALCWNPQTSEIIGELPSAGNWAFQVEWCPRNPDLLATAFFDGTVGIHSIQSTNDATVSPVTPKPDGADVFDVPGYSRTTAPTLSLKQPPKWLRRPSSCSFGFGGQLVSVGNLPAASGKNQSSVVHIRKVIAETDIVDRAQKLQQAVDTDTLSTFAEERVNSEKAGDGWKALLSLFRANSRDELVTLLGYSKEEVKGRVEEAVAKLKEIVSVNTSSYSVDEAGADHAKPHEPVVSFAEPEAQYDGSEEDLSTMGAERTPSEVSASASDAVQVTDGESTTTAPSLFGDEGALGTPQMDAGADFFSTIGATPELEVPHHNYGLDSSVAATIGSGPSSVASENLKNNTFRIYPSDESETDGLVTKALVLGDFESAVSLCLSAERYADAILLAIKGGEDLLQRTQKAYFERRTTSHPYLRLFQSIVTNDLSDIVQNADLQEWQEIFVVLCTFASQEEFSNLAEQLGSRLEFQSSLMREGGADNEDDALELRKTATLTYLAAGRLERLLNIWIEELAEEEILLLDDQDQLGSSRYAAHAHALHNFIEKVTVFRDAIKYVDGDLAQVTGEDAGAKTYKLSALYDRYFEYADVLSTQGLVKEAVTFLKLTPADYTGSAMDCAGIRERLLMASGERKVILAVPVAGTSRAAIQPDPTPAVAPAPFGYANYLPSGPVVPAKTYAPVQSVSQPSYDPYAIPAAARPIHPTSVPQLTQHQHPPPSRGPMPPSAPPKRMQNGGWNDAPVLPNDRRAPSSLNTQKPLAIVSPFPNAPSPRIASPPVPGPPHTGGHGQNAPLPPPPTSVQSRVAQRMMHPPPPSGPPAHPQGMQPPSNRLMSPAQQHAALPSVPGPYSPSMQPAQLQPTGPYVRATPPPGPLRGPGQPLGPPRPFATPPPGQAGPPAPPPGPYAPPSGQGQQPPLSPYAPPPGQIQQQHHGIPQGPPRVAPAPHPLSGLPSQQGPPGVVSAGGANNMQPPRSRQGPPPPKYPSGDRTHIPESALPIFNIINEQLTRMKQTTQPQQRRMADDLERRINSLFDALNCETLSKPVVDQLLVLARAMEAHDQDAALSIHVDLLTRGSQTDDIGLWMSAIKQLIIRM
ncbi:transport protein [Suillus decipiens]|nr:transport protein [Suillus decipiens]